MHHRHTSRRRKTLVGGLIATLATASLIAATMQPAPAAPKGKDSVGNGLRTLQPAGKSDLATVKAFLKSRGASAATLDSLSAAGSSWTYRGVTHLRLQQRVNGLRVYGGEAKASFNAKGQLIHLIDFTVKVGDMRAARVGSDAALRAAVKSLYPSRAVTRQTGRSGATTTYAKGTKFAAGPRVERVAVPAVKGLAVGYLVDTWDAASNKYYSSLVSGGGAVIHNELRTANDSYNVFTEDPVKTPQGVVNGPGNGSAQSPAGWLLSQQHTSIDITGNNAHAYLDADKSQNKPDPGGDPVSGGNFLAEADLAQQPTTDDNRAVAVQNLFYLTNLIHDTLYDAGFVEETGNFQETNFSAKGGGSDSVDAEAQDGGGTDNANFATPPDGVNPRMQMYLWTGLGTHNVVVHDAGGDITFLAQGAAWGAPLDKTGVTGVLAVADDGTAPASDACTALVGDYAGKLVVADRGACNFTEKAKNAQAKGAIGIIVANNNGSAPFTMGGADASVTIPAVMVSQTDGAAIKADAGTSTTIKLADEEPLKRDGDLDSDIVWHEYGHGLTWRMIGKMSGPLAGAVGEGMGDVLSLIANEDDRVGEYSTSDPFGVRSVPYDVYNRTYGDIVGAEVHDDGEVYAAIGWRMLQHYQGAGIDKSVLLADLVDGMNYTPREPTFEEMRDGILTGLAASQNTERDCLVWTAFAEYGVGVGAHGVANGKTATTVESFVLPVKCQD